MEWVGEDEKENEKAEISPALFEGFGGGGAAEILKVRKPKS